MEATITGRNSQDSDSAAKSDNDDNADDRWWLRKDSLTVFSWFINRVADKLQQLTVKSRGVYFFWTRCTTAFGLCAVNEKRRLLQEHRLNLSEFKGNCKLIWSTWQRCKLVGDASVKALPCVNTRLLMYSLCDFLTFANINNRGNLQLPLDMQKQKFIQLQGVFASLLTLHRGLCPPGSPLGAPPPDPRYRLALRARHGIQTMCSSKLILKEAQSHIWNNRPTWLAIYTMCVKTLRQITHCCLTDELMRINRMLFSIISVLPTYSVTPCCVLR